MFSMVGSIVCAALVAMAVGGLAPTRADEFGTAIDLTHFGAEPGEPASVFDELPLENVARRLGTAPRRFYLSGMIGPSFAQVDSPAESALLSEDTLFNAGGAIGVAFERANGRLRLETEAMGRGTYDAPFTFDPSPTDTTILTNNWSVMQNLWRDLMLTERFGIYGGGGIGAGGYILGERSEGETLYAVAMAVLRPRAPVALAATAVRQAPLGAMPLRRPAAVATEEPHRPGRAAEGATREPPRSWIRRSQEAPTRSAVPAATAATV